MPVTVTEKADSRPAADGDSPSRELKYVIRGTDSETVALTSLAAAAPAAYEGLTRKTWKVDPVGDPTDSQTWDGVVTYGLVSLKPKETGDWTFSFDTSGGTQHITQSIRNIANHSLPGTVPPDFKGAIGVTQDSVEGVDIDAAGPFNFTITAYLAAGSMTGQWLAQVYALRAKTPVNDDTFSLNVDGVQISFAAGEVRFIDFSGSKRRVGDWELQFKFSALPNRRGFSVGDITNIDKEGWQYMWVRYQDKDDSSAKQIVKRPTSVHIEEVYPKGDFSIFGIPG
jgi:hypothetical protein